MLKINHRCSLISDINSRPTENVGFELQIKTETNALTSSIYHDQWQAGYRQERSSRSAPNQVCRSGGDIGDAKKISMGYTSALGHKRRFNATAPGHTKRPNMAHDSYQQPNVCDITKGSECVPCRDEYQISSTSSFLNWLNEFQEKTSSSNTSSNVGSKTAPVYPVSKHETCEPTTTVKTTSIWNDAYPDIKPRLLLVPKSDPFSTPKTRPSSMPRDGQTFDSTMMPHSNTNSPLNKICGRKPKSLSTANLLSSSSSYTLSKITPSFNFQGNLQEIGTFCQTDGKRESDGSQLVNSGHEEIMQNPIQPKLEVEESWPDESTIPLTPVTKRPRKTHPGCTTILYERRNNPDLDKRRIHFCDFASKFTTQSHLQHFSTPPQVVTRIFGLGGLILIEFRAKKN